MTATTLAVAAGIDRGTAPEALAAIARPGTAAALWERRLPPDFAAWLDALPAAGLPACRVTGTPAALSGALGEAIGGGDGGPWRAFLIADILELAQRFATIVGTAALRLRLVAIEDDACRRFHVDHVRARLLCTYRGAGTELARPVPPGEEPRPLERLPAGTVAVLRGTLWSDREATGLLHRSPPFGPGDRTRLLLVLDPGEPACGCC